MELRAGQRTNERDLPSGPAAPSNGASPAARLRFPKEMRLRKRAEFDAVFAAKHSVADAHLIVYAMPNGRDRSRIGFVVSRRHGGAVARNRYKRVLREAYRLAQPAAPRGYDFVALPKQGAEARLATLEPSLTALLRRAARKAGEDQRLQTTDGK